MNDKYEERLGTDRMLPLVFRMALPAVIAQIVNLLYNIVDRVYIGHIPGIGTQALAGIGVAGSLIILISAFSAIVAGGGAPLAAIALGQGNRSHAGKILGRMDFFSEIWVDPLGHPTEMITILAVFVILTIYLWYIASKKKQKAAPQSSR
jgi:Na+-driven multidrug efflux pump